MGKHKYKEIQKPNKKKTSRLTKKQLLERIQELLSHSNRSLEAKEIFKAVGATTHPSKLICVDILKEMQRNDSLQLEKGKYRLSSNSSQVLEGAFIRKANGRNSVILDNDETPILVFERNALGAFNGDRVRVTLLARRKNHAPEAEVIEIIKRAKENFVGTLQVSKNYAFLITESRTMANDIFIPKEKLKGGQNGQKAIVKIIEWPKGQKNPIGKVVEILGEAGNNDTEMHAILAEFDLPYHFPKSVEEAANQITGDISEEEIAIRKDFRSVITMTIDPHDAKDFDDALSIQQIKENLWEIGVHIADVSHYVTEGSIIDKEAQKRATSVYLVDRTIPMLPEKLCNVICSLRPQEDKLAYSAIFHITSLGEIKKFELAHTVINSNRRFTYEEAQYILELNNEASSEDLALPGDHPQPLPLNSIPQGEFAKELITLNRIAKQLRKKRLKNGSIAFDREEVRFDIDKKGRPIKTYIKIAKDANKLVEEFMLLANKYVAEKIGKEKKPKTLPYRIHDVPDPEKLERLQAFITKFGYKLKTEGSKQDISKSINGLLNDVHGKEEQDVIELVALRAMMKARYSVYNIGHYGLMFDYYTHFTSPIRRYPDTLVHRLLTKYENGGRSGNIDKYEELCEHCSAMEQLAANAERASIKYKQVEYMGERLGKIFEGKISGLTEFGIYVEEIESKCEGMVPLRDLVDDFYEFDERNYILIGRKFHKRYALGDRVKIKVAKADLMNRRLDYSLVE